MNNYTIFCNVSRSLVRHLSLQRLQQNAAITPRHLYTSERQTLTNCTTTTPIISVVSCNSNRRHRNDGGGGRSSSSSRNGRRYHYSVGAGSVGSAFTFSLFGSKSDSKDDESPEERLITAIKRSILCIQKEQYDKAEQMLHIALRMAQDLQSNDGITYVYDVMANLAMEREQFKKAEALFSDVMKRLFANGHNETSPQVLHISSKMAHMAQLQGELDKALEGFKWTLQKIEENIRRMPGDKDLQELMGLTKNWYGQLLMKMGKYEEAKKLFQEAYQCLTEIYGSVNEEAVTILNNLSVACVNLDEFELGKRYLLQALDLLKELKDATQEGVLQANLGLIYLREGLVQKAKETCTLAWRNGKQSKNAEAIEQAEYCLNEIRSAAQ